MLIRINNLIVKDLIQFRRDRMLALFLLLAPALQLILLARNVERGIREQPVVILDHDHTLRHFRETWQPGLFNRRRTADWLKRGGASLGTRLRDKTIAIMESHRPQPLPGSLQDEIAYILRQA